MIRSIPWYNPMYWSCAIRASWIAEVCAARPLIQGQYVRPGVRELAGETAVGCCPA